MSDEVTTENIEEPKDEAPVEDTVDENAENESEEPQGEVLSMEGAKREAEEAEKPLMELTPNEMMALQRLRGQTQQILTQIGQIEVQKAAFLARIHQMEEQAQAAMTQAGKRMGIPEGTQWQATPEGKVTLMPQDPPMTHQQPPGR